MKKLMTAGVVMVAFVMTTSFAFASYGFYMPTTSSTAYTKTIVNSTANTGGNSIAGNMATSMPSMNWMMPTCTTCGANTINTGAAGSSVNGNFNVNVGGSTYGFGNAMAITKTVVNSGANTGNNQIYQNYGGTNTINTGSASSGVSMNSTVTVK